MTETFFDKRRSRREPWNTTLEFLKMGEGQKVIAYASSMNISRSGAAVTTDFVINPGQVIIFREMGRQSELKFCTVAWSMKDNGLYTAGLKFI